MPTPSQRAPRTPVRAADRRQLAANALLAGLPAAESAALHPLLEVVRPRARQSLEEPDAPLSALHFPVGGVFTQSILMGDGTAVVSLAVGSEGALGLPALLGATRSAGRTTCQISGWTLRAPADGLRELVGDVGTGKGRSGGGTGSVLRRRLMRYAQVQLRSLAQSVACNRLHTAPARLARWLLLTHDRAGVDELALTQSVLAEMVGVSRQTISETVRTLELAGILHTAHGRLTVEDRTLLEAEACECYAVVRAVIDALLGTPRG
jgi:CRP-like cAMP-binding protein